MSRLWEKGEALDARVLRYTAGEDHSLDERLVPFDVRGSIAHATMVPEYFHKPNLIIMNLQLHLQQKMI